MTISMKGPMGSTAALTFADASHEEVVRGQQTGFELTRLHPSAQSWIAPKLCPIS